MCVYLFYKFYQSQKLNLVNQTIQGLKIISDGCYKNIDYDNIPGRVFEIKNQKDWNIMVKNVLKMYPDVIKYLDVPPTLSDSSVHSICYLAYLLGFKYLFIKKSKYDLGGTVRLILAENKPLNTKTNRPLKPDAKGLFPKEKSCKFDQLKYDPTTKMKTLAKDKEGDTCCGYVCMKEENGKRVADTFIDRDGTVRQLMCGGSDYNFIGDSRWSVYKIRIIY